MDTCFNKAIAGLGELTFSVSDAVFPVPPFVDVISPLVLAYDPTLAAVTSTVTMQLAPAATDAPLKLTLVPFAAADIDPPVHVVEPDGLDVFVSPDGYGSEN